MANLSSFLVDSELVVVGYLPRRCGVIYVILRSMFQLVREYRSLQKVADANGLQR